MDVQPAQPAAPADLQREMNKFFWWHTIDLGNGLVTPGKIPERVMKAMINGIFPPLDLAGKTVLDVGAWTGGYSIEAARRGASKVVALDYVVWRHPHYRAKEAFNFAVRCAGLEIETVERDLAVPNSLVDLPSFDVILFLGVFYHLVDPIHVVQQLFRMTKHCLVLETHIEHLDDPRPAMVFFPTTELGNDPSNWWGPNVACVEALLRTVGFARVDTKMIGPRRGMFHAWK